MKKSWKWLGLTITVAAVAVLLLVQARRAVPVEVKEIRPETITRRIVEEGVVRAKAEYTIFPRYRDRVVSILVEEGQRVEEGQVLLVLDVREMDYAAAELEGRLQELAGEELKLTERPGEAAVAEHKLAIRQAEAQLTAAQRDFNRIERLYLDDVASEEEYNKARDRLTDAEYGLERTRKALLMLYESYDPPPGSHEVIAGRRSAYHAQIERNRYLAGEYQVFAPAAGVVGRLLPEEKELVDPQMALLTVFQDDILEVEVEVLAREVIDLAIGMPVRLTLDRPDEDVEFPGTIIRIAPQAELDISPLGLEERRVKVTVAPEIPPDLSIGPGWELDASFVTRELTGKMVVPKRALFTDDGQDALLVVEDGRAGLRRVTTGFASRLEQVIEEGLQDGDLVILNPRADGLRPGVRVQVSASTTGER